MPGCAIRRDGGKPTYSFRENGAKRKCASGQARRLRVARNKEKLNALLADRHALTEVLTYHVVPGKVLAADVIKLSEAKTVQGDTLKIAVKDGEVSVDNARVTKTDIRCSNGVIHVIDAVLMPGK